MSTYADIYGHNDIKRTFAKCIELKRYLMRTSLMVA